MSLVDILGGVAQGAVTLAGAGVVFYCGKELFNNYFIPFTEELEKDLDKHPELDDYRFSDEKKGE